MKVGFFTPHISWPTHYETELELIQTHLDGGDEVVQFVCNAELPTCDINPAHDIPMCYYCMGCRDFGAGLIEGSYKQTSFLNLRPEDKVEIGKLADLEFADVKELQKLKVENFDVGYAVASSIISRLRNPSPDLKANRQLLKSYLVSSLGVYWSMRNSLREGAFKRVYIFNGRLAHVKPVLRACQAAGVDCIIHERGNRKDFYALYENALPHDIAYLENSIRKAWAEADGGQRKKIGADFFINRSNGAETSWYSFTKEQEQGRLPGGWDDAKQNIVVFNSSEDEFASIGDEWANPVYKNQLEALQKIIFDLKDAENIHLYLRVHPNLKKVVNADKEQVYKLSGRNFTLIPAESPVSTYDLLKTASKVVSFGSTVGIEAVYWGKPSILAGKSYYRNLGGTYNVTSHEELIALLKSTLQPKDSEAALMYGYYLNTFGIPFQHYEAENLFRGTFKGHIVLSKKHAKYKPLGWLFTKPLIRNYREQLNGWHSRYLIKTKYL